MKFIASGGKLFFYRQKHFVRFSDRAETSQESDDEDDGTGHYQNDWGTEQVAGGEVFEVRNVAEDQTSGDYYP